jgi:hypothetical protein
MDRAARTAQKTGDAYTPTWVVGCNRSLWQGARHNFKWGLPCISCAFGSGSSRQRRPQRFCPSRSSRPVRFRRWGASSAESPISSRAFPRQRCRTRRSPRRRFLRCPRSRHPLRRQLRRPFPNCRRFRRLPRRPFPRRPCLGCQTRVVQRRPLRGHHPLRARPRRAARRPHRTQPPAARARPATVGRPSRAVSVTAEERPSVPTAKRAA